MKYPNKVFNVSKVHFDIKNMTFKSRVKCVDDSVYFNIEKYNVEFYDNYLNTKYTNLISDKVEEIVINAGLQKYIMYQKINIYEDINEDINDVNGIYPRYNLEIGYNHNISSKEEYAEISYKIREEIRKSQYKNVDTYIFTQELDNKIYNLVIYSEEGNITVEDILNKINHN